MSKDYMDKRIKELAAVSRMLNKLVKRNMCEDCGIKLTPTTTAYIGYSSFKTVCTKDAEGYREIGYPVSYHTVEFNEADGLPILNKDGTNTKVVES